MLLIMQFLLIPSLQHRYNIQGYYTSFHRDKLCESKETAFGKKNKSKKENFEGGKFKYRELQ